MKPTRVQMSRRKGFRLPENTVVVARPTKWGNPHSWKGYEVDVPWDVDKDRFRRQLAVEDFVRDLKHGELRFTVDDVRRELRGKNLACWCTDDECHATVLLRIANE